MASFTGLFQRDEMERVMRLIGVSSVSELGP